MSYRSLFCQVEVCPIALVNLLEPYMGLFLFLLHVHLYLDSSPVIFQICLIGFATRISGSVSIFL